MQRSLNGPLTPFANQSTINRLKYNQDQRRNPTPTYIALLKWTPQGLQNLKESPSRLDAARKSFEAGGVKMKDFFMVTGRYDMIAICEAPDEGSLARALLSVTSKGGITSETCRAFTEQEYREIIGGLA